MSKASKAISTNGASRVEVHPQREPRSAAIAADGIRTAGAFIRMMEALMDDLTSGRVAPNVGGVVVRAGQNMLKAVELQHRYGTTAKEKNRKTLALMGDEEEAKA